MEKHLVSIVCPVFNSEKFLDTTITSVLEQTYQNWELILVDDCSTDNSVKVIKKYLKKDSRITLLSNDVNSGAAITRNRGIERANGRFICFLDSDDYWDSQKLRKQVNFMLKNDYAFTFTGYEFAYANGEPNGKKVYVPQRINYNQSLKNTIISTITVMLDLEKISKDDIYMPNVRRGQDAATWWNVLKKIDYAYGMHDILSYYRRTNNSLSANKFKAIKRTWYLYRKVEHLSLLKSMYCFVFYAFNAVKKRI